VSGAAYIASLASAATSPPAKSSVFGYAADVIPMVIAFVALVAGGARRRLLPYVLGAAFLATAGVFYDALAIPAYHMLSQAGRAKDSFLLSTLGDVTGAIAVLLLLAALRRFAERGRWAAPRVVPALLLAATAAAWIAWTLVWARKVYVSEAGNYSDWSVSKFLSVDYPFVAYIALGLVAAVLVALVALGLRDRRLGGVLLLGWTVNVGVYFAQIITQGWTFPAAQVAANVAAAVLMLATAVVAIIYAARSR
jgi:hypothetical protein